MTKVKILLVEDDKSLREIYGVRLLAEGYDIVSAGDGEEALAMAIKERPQLIISARYLAQHHRDARHQGDYHDGTL